MAKEEKVPYYGVGVENRYKPAEGTEDPDEMTPGYMSERGEKVEKLTHKLGSNRGKGHECDDTTVF